MVSVALVTAIVGVDSAAAAEGDPIGYWLLEADGTVYSCGDADEACTNGTSGAVQHFGDAYEPRLVVRDDFTATTLDTDIWTEVPSPLGGDSFAYPGGTANLTVPTGSDSYQPWTSGNRAPVLRQDISNVDFDVVASFASTPSARFQLQGIVVADSNGTFLRFDVYFDGTIVKAFAADPLVSSTPLIDVAVPTSGHAANLRVTRTGSTWELHTSTDGVAWTSHGTFDRPAFVTGLGPYAGNAVPSSGTDAPAFTGMINSFGPLVLGGPASGSGALGSGVTAIGLVPTASGNGYAILLSDGTVVARGDAPHHGNLSDPGPSSLLSPGERGTAMSFTPSGAGYWIFTNVGRTVTFGDAVHAGDLPGLAITPDRDVVSSAATSGGGYYMLGADGGVFTFGGAPFFDSVPGILPGVTLACDVVGLVPTLAGDGYWMVGCDGGVFTFGNAPFVGSVPGVLGPIPLAAPVNGIVAYGGGYLMVASDGGAFTFGAPFFGSLGAVTLDSDIIAIAVAVEPAPG